MADLNEMQANVSTTAATVATTSETQAGYSGPVKVPPQTARIFVFGFCQMTLGTGTTAVTPRLRRGNGVSGTLINVATAEAVKTAAGSTECFLVFGMDVLSDQDTADYSLTVQQAGASANGSVLQSAVTALVLAG